MIRTFINLFIWFIVFGSSFLIQHLGWAEQGTAFIWIHIGTVLLIALGTSFVSIAVKELGLLITIIGVFTLSLAVSLIATWVATQLFDISFVLAFQVMTFGQCLISNSNNDN